MGAEYRPESFDPLSTVQLSNTICEIFERQPLVSMEHEIPRFEGAGLYALYYRGDSVQLYRPLAALQIPVYAGQGRSSNSATGATVNEPYPVYSRLKKHRTSIIDGRLPISEFRFRALLMPDVHADLGENGLRVGYEPVWNGPLNGFGSNEQGSTTRKSRKSKWDTVHGGRRRTYGEVVHKPEELIAATEKHIERQIEEYPNLSWRHPTSDVNQDLEAR